MNEKLYHVKCRGMTSAFGSQIAFGHAYVIASDTEAAYKKMRTALDARGLGFIRDRELGSIELVAEEAQYPDCGVVLYL